MKDKYNKFLLELYRIDVSCCFAGIILLFPINWSIPNSFVILGVFITNLCILVYSLFMNISLLLFIPLFAYYVIQSTKDEKL